MRRIFVGLVAIMLLASCTDDPTVDEPVAAALTVEPMGETDPENYGLFLTVVALNASTSDGELWHFHVTLLSEYDAPARYADAWRLLDADDNQRQSRVTLLICLGGWWRGCGGRVCGPCSTPSAEDRRR